MPRPLKKIKLEINSEDKLQALLQEIYDECCRNIKQCTDTINKLNESTKLSEETLEMKTKFTKAINETIAQKNNAISRKIYVAKQLQDLLKHTGDVSKRNNAAEPEKAVNLDLLIKQIKEKG